MQIRLTVQATRGGAAARGRDVIVTAPAGTTLGAVAGGLLDAAAAAASGGGGTAGGTAGGAGVAVYAGQRLLDPDRTLLGEPPLIDGAVLSLGGPSDPGHGRPAAADAAAVTSLRVVAGPDAGGVHLLHGGQIRIGRSADADVPLDDPDVSRLHCALTVTPDGGITVVDLGSTNGTTIDGLAVGTTPVPLRADAVLRVGESALRIAGPARDAGSGSGRADAGGAADGDGQGPDSDSAEHSRVPEQRRPREQGTTTTGLGSGWPAGGGPEYGDTEEGGAQNARAGAGHGGGEPGGGRPGPGGAGRRGTDAGAGYGAAGADRTHGGAARGAGDDARAAHGSAATNAGYGEGYLTPGRSTPAAGAPGEDSAPGRGGHPADAAGEGAYGAGRGSAESAAGRARGRSGAEGPRAPGEAAPRRGGTPTRGTVVPPELRSRGEAAGAAAVPQPPRRGIRAWARRLGGREDAAAPAATAPATARTAPRRVEATGPHDRYPDAAALLLAALADEAAYRPGFLSSPDDSPAHHLAHPGGTDGFPHPGSGTGGPARPGADARTPARSGDTGPSHAAGAAGESPYPGAGTEPSARPGALGGRGLVFRRGSGHADALVVRLGTEFRAGGGTVPLTVDLRRAGSLALAGPRGRLAGLARSVVAQLAALHGPDALELVLISADPTRPHESRVEDWSWAGWLPHVRPRQGQDCRLLLAYDREQAAARVGELQRRLAQPVPGTRSVVVVDGDPGTAAVRDAVARLAEYGPAAGVHLVCLAETAPATPASPLTATYAAAGAAAPGFAACGAVGLLSGDVATSLRLLQRPAAAPGSAAAEPGAPRAVAPPGPAEPPAADPHDAADDPADGSSPATAYGTGRARLGGDGCPAPAEPAAAGGWFEAAAAGPAAAGPAGTVDAVSAAWAERLARALAPYGERDDADDTHLARRGALPGSVRLLDELDLARATPTALTARWLESRSGAPRVGAVLGAGPTGRLMADLAAGPLAVEGAARGGKSELLRSFAAALAAGEPPERLQLVLVDGAGRERGDALGAAADLPHVSGYLVASDPVRMREFAQELGAEFKRRAARYAPEGEPAPQGPAIPGPRSAGGAADIQAPQSNTLRLRPRPASEEAPGAGTGARAETGAGGAEGPAGSRGTTPPHVRTSAPPQRQGTTPPHGTPAPGGPEHPAAARRGTTPPHGTPAPGTPGAAPHRGTTPPYGAQAAAAPGGRQPAPPVVVLVVDDYDALVAPALGSPARPAAGSVVRVVEAIARDGGPLGMHLVTASAQPEATAATAAVSGAAHHVVLGGDDVPPGRGLLCAPGAEPVPFQAARVTGRIPRTATARPTVVPLEWARMGSPPTSRPLRELGNGPTDLALLASALQRAAGTPAAQPDDTRTPSP
ncbi:FHA domain-containing protein [Streptomyces sp. B5E4]|uniref:FHA domain-containing protein n=1 Tax=Streptomyces sp. B5E4 TaxID=3153568 RepID=UPI00325CCA6D